MVIQLFLLLWRGIFLFYFEINNIDSVEKIDEVLIKLEAFSNQGMLGTQQAY